MEYELNENDLFFAKQFIQQLQVEDGMTDPVMPGDMYLHKLLSSDTSHVLVALENNIVVGGLTAYELSMFAREENEMFLYDITVTESHRQKGIAGKLIGLLKKICIDKGIKIIFVGTSTDSEPAIKLYKATGGDMEIIPWFTYNLEDEIPG